MNLVSRVTVTRQQASQQRRLLDRYKECFFLRPICLFQLQTHQRKKEPLYFLCGRVSHTTNTLKVQFSCSYKTQTHTHTHFFFMSMAGEQGDRCSSITIPLLDDEKVHQVNGSEETLVAKTCDLHTAHVGNTSFFKTCFHLINALSGLFCVSSFLFLSLSLLITIYDAPFLAFFFLSFAPFWYLVFFVQLYSSLASLFGSVFED